MRVTTDDLGVVAFVLPGRPNVTFDLHEWPDGSFSLEPADVAAEVLGERRARPALDLGLRSA